MYMNKNYMKAIKKYLLGFVLLLGLSMPLVSFAQQNGADSLKTFLSYAGTDTEKINILNKIAVYYQKLDSNKLQLEYLSRGLHLAKSKNLEAKAAELSKQIGDLYRKGSQYDSALSYMKYAEAYYLKVPPGKKLLGVYHAMGDIYRDDQKYSEANEYYTKYLDDAEKQKDSLSIQGAYNAFGTMYYQSGEYKIAIGSYNKGLDIALASKNYSNAMQYYSEIGTAYAKLGLTPSSQEAFLSALKINAAYVKREDVVGIMNVNIGNLYNEQKDTAKSLKYYRDGLHVFQKLKQNARIAIVLGNIGNAYMEAGDYKNAEKYELESLEQLKKYGEKSNIAQSYTNIGEFYNKTKQYAKSLEYYSIALNMAEEADDKELQVYSLAGMSTLNVQVGDNKRAQDYGLQAIELAQKIHLLLQVRDISKDLSGLFKKTNQTDKAFYYYQLYVDTKDSIENKENSKKMINAELNYEYEQKQQAQKLEDEKKEAISAEKAHHERTIRNIYLGGFIVVLFLTILVFRNFLRVRKSNKIITEQKHEVELQKTLVEEKNRDITDSINYARRIQQAMLPTKEQWDHYFKESFIYYQPKDIVSGDFYWCMGTDKGIVFSVADCTGHGVPGAFMSMLGISSLNKIVGEQGIMQPDKVLNELRNEIIKSLNPEGKLEEVKDGMDMTLCYLDRKNGVLEYAAANNPLWIARKKENGYELIEGEADKMPVGKFMEEGRLFSNYKIEVKKGDRLYIFTDGYADQFGGEKGKKFKYRQLQEKILNISNKPLAEQKEMLETTMNQWKGKLEQVDDILVIGLEV
jgi:serine phosphatase RsbU (regulator of sigma subunit)